jgi:photosystem II stability/assembly factor-like uncharacterized protein
MPLGVLAHTLPYAFADLDHGWIAPASGLLATADGGKTWKVVGRVPGTILSLSAISPTHLWAGTTTGLYRTSDAGATWTDVSFDTGYLRQVGWVDFVDPGHGWMEVWADPQSNQPRETQIRRTSDGGDTWQAFANPCDPEWGWVFDFTDASIGWVLCAGQPSAGSQGKDLYRTGDGGDHWTKVTRGIELFHGYAAGLAAADARHVWITLEYGGEILASADGGASWTSAYDVLALGMPGRFGKPTLLSPRHALVSAWDSLDGVILATRDGGAHWTQVYPPYLSSSGYSFVDGQRGLAAGMVGDPQAILATGDGGSTWQRVGRIPGGPNGSLSGIQQLTFVDARHGWVLATLSGTSSPQDAIFATADGGRSWTRIAFPTRPPDCLPSAIALADDRVGFVATACGDLLVTRDGGSSFSALPSLGLSSTTQPATMILRFRDERDGWRVTNGRIYHTSDGAETWTMLPLADNALQVIPLPKGRVWATVSPRLNAGPVSVVRTDDDGRTWMALDFAGASVNPGVLTFGDATHGWLTATDPNGAAHLLHTTDGGQTWTYAW